MKTIKIGILTFHRPINYGAFLQSYALRNKLASMDGIEAEIIDYIAPKEKKKIYTNVLRRVKRYGIKAGIIELKKIKVFKNALSLQHLSQEKFCTTDLKRVFEYIDNKYDVLIIGSDAVFNWNQNGYPSAFIPQYSFSIPVFSYAASVHGLKYLSEPEERINESGQSFANIKKIFVRDLCTEQFVHYCNPECEAIHSCDPTFLLSFDSLYQEPHRSIDSLRKQYKLKHKYIVLMLTNEEISKSIYEKYKNKYIIVSLFMSNKYSDCFMHDLTPIEWCLVLKNAEMVITNYFHGTLLSLQQGTAAIAIDLSHYGNPYEGKLDDMMNRRLNLPDLYYKVEEWPSNKDKFFRTMEKCLLGDFCADISNSVKKEASSFSSFAKEISAELNR